jgi:amino acid adenylation domain-containing protein
LAFQFSVSLNTIFQAAWAKLLSTCSGESIVTFGQILHGRSIELPDIDPLSVVGMTLQVTPVIVDLSNPSLPLTEFFSGLVKSHAFTEEHQLCSLVEINKMLGLISGQHAFQTLFIFGNYPVPPTKYKWDHLASPARSNFPLCLSCYLNGNDVTIELAFNTAFYSESTARLILKYFSNILESVALKGNVSSLTMVLPEAKDEITSWNEIPKNSEVEVFSPLIPEIFSGERAEATAIKFSEQSLTYAQLDAASELFSKLLSQEGVKFKDAVGILLPPSLELAIAVLGSMRMGVAFVPLNPDHPKDRITYQATHSGVKRVVIFGIFFEREMLGEIILADRGPWSDLFSNFSVDEHKDILPSTLKPLILKQKFWESEILEHVTLPDLDPTQLPDAIAYILYTSGTTGLPKGVLVQRKALSNFVRGMRKLLSMNPSDRFFSPTSFTFDIFYLELLVPLVSGSCVILVGPGKSKDGEHVLDTLQKEKVTFIQATPSLYRILVESGWNVNDRSSRDLVILCGGEEMPCSITKELLKRGKRVFNLYGPTEATIWATYRIVTQEDADRQDFVPIGKPLPNYSVWILDKQHSVVPVGVFGELCIGGAGLALGYHKSTQNTKRKFIVHKDLGRLYHTGDRACYLENGEIRFLGRSDLQVKLRGHRIEPAEIEMHIDNYEYVKQAVVVVRNNNLIAHVMLSDVTENSEISKIFSSIKQNLRTILPEYMVPSLFVPVTSWPLNVNGKINREGLTIEEALLSPAIDSVKYVAPGTDIETRLVEFVEDLLQIKNIGVENNIFEAGMHSLLLVSLQKKILAAWPGVNFRMAQFFKYPSVSRLAKALKKLIQPDTTSRDLFPKPESTTSSRTSYKDSISIIGIACRLPGANYARDFWETVVCQKKDAITRFTPEQLKYRVSENVLNNPQYVRAMGIIKSVDKFDNVYFGIHANEAEKMDPQQRLLLETCHAAIEDAGYDPTSFGKSNVVGVWASMATNTYYVNNVLPSLSEESATLGDDTDFMHAQIGNGYDFLAQKLAYHFNARGPCMNVQTACSSSLVAVHMAKQALLAGECDVAIVGAVSVMSPLKSGYLSRPNGIWSPSGKCRPFSLASDGIVKGNGVSVVILKRASDAEKDSEYAIILGSSVNNDGATKASFTAPNPKGQIKVIREALSDAQIEATRIGYVETHGTGTKIGDQIEIEALKEVWSETPEVGVPIPIGSVKANIGHLDVAAGVTGLIKAALALKHGVIPPMVGINNPEDYNPAISSSPFFLPAKDHPWPENPNSEQRLAAVSSFGFGGTNAHVILSEAKKKNTSFGAQPGNHQLVVLSAKTNSAVENTRARLCQFLRSPSSEVSIDSFCWTLQKSRSGYSQRIAFVSDSRDLGVLAQQLSDSENFISRPEDMNFGDAPTAFIFPGQGSQYPRMGKDLYLSMPRFREALDSCSNILESLGHSTPLHELLGYTSSTRYSPEDLSKTGFAQIALFAIEYAVSRLWISLGIRPVAFLGHSSGEYTAAVYSGIISLKDALRMIVKRGELMESTGKGAMISVQFKDFQELRTFLSANIGSDSDVEISAMNSTSSYVLAGSPDHIEAIVEKLKESGKESKKLHVSHAFHHSAFMNPILEEWQNFLGSIEFKPPSLPFLSSMTGDWETERVTSPEYWVQQLYSPVNFQKSIRTLLAHYSRFIEAGPGRVLSTYLRSEAQLVDNQILVVGSLRHVLQEENDSEFFLKSVGTLWCAGTNISFSELYSELPISCSLPNYAFDSHRHWIKPQRQTQPRKPHSESTSGLPEEISESPQQLRTETTKRSTIEEIVANSLGVGHVPLDTPLVQLGASSIDVINISNKIREHHQIYFSPNEMLVITTNELIQRSAQGTKVENTEIENGLSEIEDGISETSAPNALQRLYYLEQLEPQIRKAFIVATVGYLRNIKKRIFLEAFKLLVEAQPFLQTSLAWDGKDVKLKPRAPAPVSFLDVSGLHGLLNFDLESYVMKVVASLGSETLSGSLYLPCLVKLDATSFAFIFVAHHAVCDGWSFNILLRQLDYFYSQIERQHVPGLGAAPKKLSLNQILRLSGINTSAQEEALKFWREALEGSDLVLELPTDHSRPTKVDYCGKSSKFKISPSASKFLREYSKQKGVTMFVTLLSFFKLFLYGLTESEDICVGTFVADRPHVQLADVIGLFLNMIPLRSVINSEMTFAELIETVAKTVSRAMAHRHVHFEQLVEDTQKTGRAQRDNMHPIFQVEFVYHNLGESYNPRSFDLTGQKIVVHSSQVDLAVHVSDNGDYDSPISGRFEYQSSLFHEPTIHRMISWFEDLIKRSTALISSLTWKLRDLVLLNKEEEQQLIEWNDTESFFPNFRVHEIIAEHYTTTPDNIAIESVDSDSNALTYKKLGECVGFLAGELQNLEKGDEVGVLLPRSPLIPISLLTLMHLGVTFVPLNSKHPEAHVKDILSQVNVKVILTTREYHKIFSLDQFNCIFVEEKINPRAELPHVREIPKIKISGTDIMYIMFTSGTTGRSKGVRIRHQGITAQLHYFKKIFNFSEKDSILQLAHLTFDVSLLEIFLPLMYGGKVILTSPETAIDPLKLTALVTRPDVTYIQGTPSLYRLMIAGGWQKKKKKNLSVLSGGEAITPELSSKLLKRAGRVFNVYGPTETTIWATVKQLTIQEQTTISVGKPLDNYQVWILNKFLKPVPIGVPGQICISGIGVGAGFSGPATSHLDKFSTIELFGKEILVYQTGDRGVLTRDRELQYLGRIDHQIKIRGYRIEPRGIEELINSNSEISRSVVIASNDTLVAYLVAKPNVTLSNIPLRASLARNLPQYMLPHTYVQLEAIPLNTNGKVDISKLPPPTRENTISFSEEEMNIPPRDTVEWKVMQLMDFVLESDLGSITSNFFDFGGNSFSAVRLMGEIERAFGFKLPVPLLVQHPTVEAMANHLKTHETSTHVPFEPLVPLQPLGTKRPIFFVHPAGGIALFFQSLAKHLGQDQPLYVLEDPSIYGNTPYPSISAMAEAYLTSMKKIQPEGPYTLFGFCFGGVVALEMTKQLQPNDVALLGLLDAQVALNKFEEPETLIHFIIQQGKITKLLSTLLPQAPAGEEETFILQLSVEELWTTCEALIKETRLAPVGLEREYLTKFVSYFRHHISLQNEYEIPSLADFPGRVVFIHSLQKFDEAKLNKWKDFLPTGFQVVPTPGSHLSMIYEPHVQHLAQSITSLI